MCPECRATTCLPQVTLLIDKSRSNSELLSDMLVNSGGQGADEFENDLIKDLMKEVGLCPGRGTLAAC
eukprot:scaffold49353_cov15-Tisochrysis_lutea.AAC.1